MPLRLDRQIDESFKNDSCGRQLPTVAHVAQTRDGCNEHEEWNQCRQTPR